MTNFEKAVKASGKTRYRIAKEVAEITGLGFRGTETQLGRYIKSGKHPKFREILSAYAAALGVTIDDLIN